MSLRYSTSLFPCVDTLQSLVYKWNLGFNVTCSWGLSGSPPCRLCLCPRRIRALVSLMWAPVWQLSPTGPGLHLTVVSPTSAQGQACSSQALHLVRATEAHSRHSSASGLCGNRQSSLVSGMRSSSILGTLCCPQGSNVHGRCCLTPARARSIPIPGVCSQMLTFLQIPMLAELPRPHLLSWRGTRRQGPHFKCSQQTEGPRDPMFCTSEPSTPRVPGVTLS